MQNTGIESQKKWLTSTDIPDVPEADRAECLLQQEMDFWAYEDECMQYWHISYTPTARQYYCFLKYAKFRDICKA